jgi:hypothetical protein
MRLGSGLDQLKYLRWYFVRISDATRVRAENQRPRAAAAARFGFPWEIPRNSRGKGNSCQSDVISATGI